MKIFLRKAFNVEYFLHWIYKNSCLESEKSKFSLKWSQIFKDSKVLKQNVNNLFDRKHLNDIISFFGSFTTKILKKIKVLMTIKT